MGRRQMRAALPTSVLLPVRDAVGTIDAAVASVLAQTDGDFELICIDDGSRDGTGERLRAWAARDRRVRVVGGAVKGAPGDLVAALERGRREARGAWLLRMDADDLAHPRRLAEQRALLAADPRLGAVGCLVRSFPEAALGEGRRAYDAWLNGLRTHDAMARARFVECPLAHPSLLLRAQALAAIGGYRAFEGPEDFDLVLRLVGAGWRLGKLDRVRHFWREGAERLSRRDPRYGPAGFARARAEALAALLAGRPCQLLGAGRGGRRLAKALLAAGVRPRRFIDLDPKKVGRAPYGVPVEPADDPSALGEALVLTSVNAWGARAAARAWLESGGRVEGRDFFLAG